MFQLQFTGNKIEGHRLVKDFQAHLRDINDIVIIEQKNILITCSSDGTCKVMELATLRNLMKLTFRLNINEKKGYLFRSIYYDERNKYLYTTQAPLTGDSYITKWFVSDGFRPIDSTKITGVSTCSIDHDYESGTLVLGDNKGSVIFIDSSSLSKIKEVNVSEISIKSIKYHKGNVISSSADNNIRVLKNFSKGFFSLFGFIKIVLCILVILFSYICYEEKMKVLKLVK